MESFFNTFTSVNESNHSTTRTCSITIDSNNTSSDFSHSYTSQPIRTNNKSQQQPNVTSNVKNKTNNNGSVDHYNQQRQPTRKISSRRNRQNQQDLGCKEDVLIVEEEEEEDEDENDHGDDDGDDQTPVQTLARRETISPMRRSTRSNIGLQQQQLQENHRRQSLPTPQSFDNLYGGHVQEEQNMQMQQQQYSSHNRMHSISDNTLQSNNDDKPLPSPRRKENKRMQQQQSKMGTIEKEEKFAEIFVGKRNYNLSDTPTVLESPLCPLFGPSQSYNNNHHHHQQNPTRIGSPTEDYLDAMLFLRGYSTKRYPALDSAYYNEPTELQEASYSPYIVKLVKHDDIPSLRDLFHVGISSNPSNYFGDTIAHYVCRLHKVHILNVMMEHGCEIRIADSAGTTPLHEACRSDKPSFELIDAIVQHDRRMFHITDSYGRVPLAYVPPMCYNMWNEYIDSTKDMYWPIRPESQKFVEQKPPRLTLLKPNSRPARDPVLRLKLEYVRLLSNGTMKPNQVVPSMEINDDDFHTTTNDYGNSNNNTDHNNEDNDNDTLHTSDMPTIRGKQRFPRGVHMSGLELLQEHSNNNSKTQTNNNNNNSDHYPSSSKPNVGGKMYDESDDDDNEEDDEDVDDEEDEEEDGYYGYSNTNKMLSTPRKPSSGGGGGVYDKKNPTGRYTKQQQQQQQEWTPDSSSTSYTFKGDSEGSNSNPNSNTNKNISNSNRKSYNKVSPPKQSYQNNKQQQPKKNKHRGTLPPENRQESLTHKNTNTFDDALFQSPDAFERVLFNSSTNDIVHKINDIDLDADDDDEEIEVEEANDEIIVNRRPSTKNDVYEDYGGTTTTTARAVSKANNKQREQLYKQMSGLQYDDDENEDGEVSSAVQKLDRILVRRNTTDQVNPLLLLEMSGGTTANDGDENDLLHHTSGHGTLSSKNTKTNRQNNTMQQQQQQQQPTPRKIVKPPIKYIDTSDEHSVSTISLSPISKQLQRQTLEQQQLKLQKQQQIEEELVLLSPPLLVVAQDDEEEEDNDHGNNNKRDATKTMQHLQQHVSRNNSNSSNNKYNNNNNNNNKFVGSYSGSSNHTLESERLSV